MISVFEGGGRDKGTGGGGLIRSPVIGLQLCGGSEFEDREPGQARGIQFFAPLAFADLHKNAGTQHIEGSSFAEFVGGA